MRLIQILNFVVLWSVSMVWHLLRILCGRPDFEKLSDTGSTVLSFFAVFVAGGLFRGIYVANMSLLFTLGLLLVYFIIYFVFFEREGRSSALVAALMGSNAACNLLAGSLDLMGVVSQASWGWIVANSAWLIITLVQFHKAPFEVQQAGYGRQKIGVM